MEKSELNLIWIDLEMTGLDTVNDAIIEIATAVTDPQLAEIAQGPSIVIHRSDSELNGMDKWNKKQHLKSGLTEEVRNSVIDYGEAEARTLEFLKQYADKSRSPMCGNSICQDRRFLARCMPELEQFFHYRNLDVSTLKELARRWYPEEVAEQTKAEDGKHRAMHDVLASIEELRFYRSCLFHRS